MPQWRIIKGKLPILLSAPHNFPHLRENVYKFSDVNTGHIVEELTKRTNCWGIISESIQSDPNFDTKSSYRDKLKDLVQNNHIQFVLDIHGRREDYPHLLDAIPNNEFRKKYIDLLNQFNVKDFDHPNQVQIVKDLTIPSLEIEIRRDGREIGTENYLKTMEILELLVLSLNVKSSEIL